MCEKSVFKHEFQCFGVFMQRPSGANNQPGMIVNNAAQEQFVFGAINGKAMAMHEIG